MKVLVFYLFLPLGLVVSTIGLSQTKEETLFFINESLSENQYGAFRIEFKRSEDFEAFPFVITRTLNKYDEESPLSYAQTKSFEYDRHFNPKKIEKITYKMDDWAEEPDEYAIYIEGNSTYYNPDGTGAGTYNKTHIRFKGSKKELLRLMKALRYFAILNGADVEEIIDTSGMFQD